MTTTHDYRRQNLRKIAQQYGGVTPLAQLLGYTNASFVVQMIGPSPMRQVSEANARKYEQTLGLLPMSLDTPVQIPESDLVDPDEIKARQSSNYYKGKVPDEIREGVVRQSKAQSRINQLNSSSLMSREQVADLVSMVSKVCSESHVDVPTNKFADIIALTLLNKGATTGTASEDYVKMLVSLTK